MAIAPHINCEVRLVLSGTKKLAVIEKAKDPYGFALAISIAGTGALACDVHRGEAIITLPSNRGWIDHYHWLGNYGVKLLGLKEYHRRMGKVFGYTDKDIEDFISANINCTCSKCTGENNVR